MFLYIIRLDDACPTMKHANWKRMEELLDKYEVKPIVGVIPDCKDPSEDFQDLYDLFFWEKVQKWQKKGWEISQHGLHHLFHDTPSGVKYFQKNIGNYTEFAGKNYEEQKNMIEEGYQVLLKNGVSATSFFAPAHTYDKNTVKACKNLGYFRFISDGYALKPFIKDEMLFIPSIFDTPHKMLFGVYTFIFHPSKMDDESFIRLEKFLQCYKKQVTTVNDVLKRYNKISGQGVWGKFIEYSIHILRSIRKNEL